MTDDLKAALDLLLRFSECHSLSVHIEQRNSRYGRAQFGTGQDEMFNKALALLRKHGIEPDWPHDLRETDPENPGIAKRVVVGGDRT